MLVASKYKETNPPLLHNLIGLVKPNGAYGTRKLFPMEEAVLRALDHCPLRRSFIIRYLKNHSAEPLRP